MLWWYTEASINLPTSWRLGIDGSPGDPKQTSRFGAKYKLHKAEIPSLPQRKDWHHSFLVGLIWELSSGQNLFPTWCSTTIIGQKFEVSVINVEKLKALQGLPGTSALGFLIKCEMSLFLPPRETANPRPNPKTTNYRCWSGRHKAMTPKFVSGPENVMQARIPTNLSDLHQFCQKKWTRTPRRCC